MKIACLRGVPIDDNKNSILWLSVATLAAFWEAYDDVHRDIRLWAARLRQRLHASVRPMPHGMYALAGRTGPGIGLDLAQHAQPVVFPGHKLERAFGTEMPCDRINVVALGHLHMPTTNSWDIQLHSIVEESIMLLPMVLVLA